MNYAPTPEWLAELEAMTRDYQTAKAAKQYAVSDTLRKKLESAGVVDLDTNPRWHPVFESSESRTKRLED
jgi:cysteinyl-tRNA synthetase